MDTPLKNLRKKSNLTLRQLADAVSLDPSNLSRIERGQQPATPILAEKIANYFDGKVTEMQILYPERYQGKEEHAQTNAAHG